MNYWKSTSGVKASALVRFRNFFLFLPLTEDFGQSNICSSVIFGVAIRKRWKWRNDEIFGAADVLAFVCDIEKSQQSGPAANRDRKELWECWNNQGDIALFNTDPYNTLKYF